MPAAQESILVRSVNWLGDAVMSTPALLRLREARPNARITLLSPEKLTGLWEGQTFVDEVMAFSASESVRQVARRLRGKRFVIALAFPNSIRSALELWLAGIPKRIGLWSFGRSFLLTDAVPAPAGALEMRKRSPREIQRRIKQNDQAPRYPADAHHVHRYLRLTTVLGAAPQAIAPRIDVSDQELQVVRVKFGLMRDPSRSWFGLNPGAEYGPAKRWPAERFVAAARALQNKTGCRWAVLGGPGDAALADSISREMVRATGERPLNLAGETSLRELAAALKICDFVLTNDTGPMHLAAAVGTATVAIFGSTSPELTGAVFSTRAKVVRCDVPCSPCFQRECPIDLRCLQGIEVDQVVAAARECLKIKA
jgi:heptosyltransferase-2